MMIAPVSLQADQQHAWLPTHAYIMLKDDASGSASGSKQHSVWQNDKTHTSFQLSAEGHLSP